MSLPKLSIPIRRLTRFDRSTITRHFLALGSEDRRLRFGGRLNDLAVGRYVEGIDFERDALFGVLDDDLHIIGVAHIARGDEHAELGVSVLASSRDHGIGGALLKHAHTHARNWGARALFMHCLTENGAMMHLARKEHMELVAEAGDADAWLKLPPADASSYISAVFEQYLARLDHVLKCQRAGLGRIADSLIAAMASS